MKKFCVLAFVCLLMAGSAKSQGVGFGIKGGVNMSKLDGVPSDANRTGYHFGAYVRVKLGGIGLQPELYYSSQGGKGVFATVSESIAANYVNVPVLIRFNPVPILNFHAGPQFGFLLGGDDIAGESLTDQLKGSDLSAVVGAGLDLPFGLNVALRYVKGLSGVNDGGDLDVKNNMFQISLGYDLVKIGK